MVVPIPGHELQTLTAVIDCHRRLLRMTSDEMRRRVRPESALARMARIRAVPIGPRLFGGPATIQFGATTGR